MKIDHWIAIGEGGGGAQFAEWSGFSQEEQEARHAYIWLRGRMDRPKWVGELIAVSPDAVGASGTIVSYRGA